MSVAFTTTSSPPITQYNSRFIHQWRSSFSTNLPFSPRDPSAFSSSHLKLTTTGSPEFSRISLRCNSSITPGGPDGENESKSVLDAFFLGKALAEALNERIESTVGEILSTVGKLQAEQQKQVQEFQDEVLERAKRAKEKAAREAMETQGRLTPKSSTVEVSKVGNGGVTLSTTSSTSISVTPEVSPTPSGSTEQPSTSAIIDPFPGVSDED